MGKVIGLGGIFFRCENPAELRAWYKTHLGLPATEYGAKFLPKALPEAGYQVWSPFDKDSEYLGPEKQPFMVNLMVDDLNACLEQVRAGGAKGIRGPDVSEYGSFGWFLDPESRQVELWQPAPELPSDVK